jgi:hypothetical protein
MTIHCDCFGSKAGFNDRMFKVRCFLKSGHPRSHFSDRTADRSRLIGDSTGFFFSEKWKTLRVNQDHRSERKSLQSFEHPHPLNQLVRGVPRETQGKPVKHC